MSSRHEIFFLCLGGSRTRADETIVSKWPNNFVSNAKDGQNMIGCLEIFFVTESNCERNRVCT